MLSTFIIIEKASGFLCFELAALLASCFSLKQSLSNHFFCLLCLFLGLCFILFSSRANLAASWNIDCNHTPDDSTRPASILCLQLSIMLFIGTESNAFLNFSGLLLTSHLIHCKRRHAELTALPHTGDLTLESSLLAPSLLPTLAEGLTHT